MDGTAEASEERDFVVVANRSAGSVEEPIVTTVEDRLGRVGEVRVTWTDDPSDLDAVLEEVTDEVLVVIGGDGTLHHAVNRVVAGGHGDRVDVGLVPTGTGNDFARSVGIPDEPVEAVDALVLGAVRTVGVIRTPDGFAVNAVHVGLGARAALFAARLKFLGPLAYRAGGLAAGVVTSPVTAEIVLDDWTVTDPLLVAAAMNGSTVGGGTRMADGDPTEDRLRVVLIRDDGRLARVGTGMQALKGDLPEDSSVTVHLSRCVEMRFASPQPVNVDGENAPAASTVTLELVPDAWRLVAPPERATAS